MTKKKKPLDSRVPVPFTPEVFKEIKTFLNGMPARTKNMYNIDPKEVKNFVKVNDDDRKYMEDVVEVNNVQPDTIVHTVKVPTIGEAVTASSQFREVGQGLLDWGQFLLRNALQADSYGYQHSAHFESYVDGAVSSDVKGAQMIKDKLISNRETRKRKAAATRAANAKKTNKLPPTE